MQTFHVEIFDLRKPSDADARKKSIGLESHSTLQIEKAHAIR